MRYALAIILALLSGPTLAAATPWQVVASGARLRLISSDVRQPDGTTLVGLELDMPDDFKTYWRLPGESGIPTEIDVEGSTGITGSTIEWPYPTPEITQGLLDYVYHGPTVLPVTLKLAADAPLLKASVVMGVCSEVCVPVRASFSLPLSFATADSGQSIRLKQAEALSPIAWNRGAPPFDDLRYDAAAGGLTLTVGDPAIDPASIIASTADPTVVFDAPQKSPDGRSMVLRLRDAASKPGWTDKPVQLTFMTPMGSFEVSQQVTAPKP